MAVLFIVFLLLSTLDRVYTRGVHLELVFEFVWQLGIGDDARVGLAVANLLVLIAVLSLMFLLLTKLVEYTSIFTLQLITAAAIIGQVVLVALPDEKDNLTYKSPDPALQQIEMNRGIQVLVAMAYSFVVLLVVAYHVFQIHVNTAMYKSDSWLVRMKVLKRRDMEEKDGPLLLGDLQLPRGYELTGTVGGVTLMYIQPWWKILLRPLVQQHVLSYVGEVDASGLPHGYGEWRDSHWHGENLRGFWWRGLPRGPFRSRETGSSSCFVNFRVGYIRNRAEKNFAGAQCLPLPGKITYGVLAAECSVSGAFFRQLPALDFILGPLQTNQAVESVDISFRFGEGVLVQGQGLQGGWLKEQLKIRRRNGKRKTHAHLDCVEEGAIPDSGTEGTAPCLCGSSTPSDGVELGPCGVSKSSDAPIDHKPTTIPPPSSVKWGSVEVCGGGVAQNVGQTSGAEIQQTSAPQPLPAISLRSANRDPWLPWYARMLIDPHCDAGSLVGGRGSVDRKLGSSQPGDEDWSTLFRRWSWKPSDAAALRLTQGPGHTADTSKKDIEEGGEHAQFELNQQEQEALDVGEIGCVGRSGVSSRGSSEERRMGSVASQEVLLSPVGPSWVQGQDQYEVFLYIHGLGVDSQKAMSHFSQMLALTNFPSLIVPIAFCWPSGRVLGYYAARYLGAEAPSTSEALLATLKALTQDGLVNFHLMTHSMGARVLGGALPLIEAWVKEKNGVPFTIKSVTLLNPDFSLKKFAEDTGPRLRRLCPLVTVYGDRNDRALAMSEIFNALGRPWVEYWQRGKRGPCNPIQGSPPSTSSSSAPSAAMPLNCQHMDVWRQAQHKEPKWLESWLDLSLGKRIYDIMDPVSGQLLDIDVVDISYLSSNVGTDRHVHHNLNQDLLRDIWEVVVQGKRARDRANLEYLTGNVYSMKGAPTYLKSRQLGS